MLPPVPNNLQNFPKLQEYLESLRDALATEGGGAQGAQGAQGATGAQGAQGAPETATLATITGGTTTNTLTAVFTHTGAAGLAGAGSIKNTGGSNTLTVRRTGTDAYGTTDFQEDDVAPGASLTWPMDTAVGTALPEFTTFVVSVKSTVSGNHTTYDLRHTSHGT